MSEANNSGKRPARSGAVYPPVIFLRAKTETRNSLRDGFWRSQTIPMSLAQRRFFYMKDNSHLERYLYASILKLYRGIASYFVLVKCLCYPKILTLKPALSIIER